MRSRTNESGIALITAMLLGTIALMLSVAMISYAMRSEPIARENQDWNASLETAQAGVDDFLHRLTTDPEYWRYGQTGGGTPPDANAALNPTGAANHTGAPIPGGGTTGKFSYTVTGAPNATTGAYITLKTTGKVRGETRTVTTRIKRRGFVDYLYFTEFEQKDPALDASPSTYEANCGRHWYDTPIPSFTNCSRIYFNSTDTIRGPLHTNDKMWLSGTPDFEGPVTTSWNAAAPRYGVNPSGGATPSFQRAGDPAYAPPLGLPKSNLKLRSLADKGIGGEGCLYTGPTRITLNANGTMNVASPYSQASDLNQGPTPTSTCGPGNNLPLPKNGVIYVQNMPSSTSDPYWKSTTPCVLGSTVGLPVPVTNDLANTGPTSERYTCDRGDAFVSGVLQGRLTISAENRIIVVGNTTYNTPPTNPASTDFLGLIGQNFVEVFHPARSCTGGDTATCKNGGQNLTGSVANITIHAAILSLEHSFRVQRYDKGAHLGDLTVVGAIAQRYRGIVTLINYTGYGKNYSYDNRLKYQSPPHFLDPIQAPWQTSTWTEEK